MADTTFQRARRPEQVEARRDAILATARRLLGERCVADISLRELSDAVGLAKSNVLRYFDSREAIFLEVLDQEWTAWLDEIERELSAVAGSKARRPYERETAIAAAIARTIASRRLLCELISSMAAVLEKNISLEFARSFKYRAAAHTARLAGMVGVLIPALDAAAAELFAGTVFVVIAGLWPYVTPTEAVAQVTAEMGATPMEATFEHNLREGLANQLVGLVVRSGLGQSAALRMH